MFNASNVKVVKSVQNWEESIKLAAMPLVDNGIVEARYIDKMIENIHNLGFYVVLADNIAMPHARPEDGVLKTGVSFLKIEEPTMYGDNSIQLVFVLAAKDSDSHIDTIGKLLEIFQNEELVDKLSKINDINILLELLK